MRLLPAGSVLLLVAGVLAVGPASAAGPLTRASAASLVGSTQTSSPVGRHDGADPAWFVDQLSPTRRAAQIKVPRSPARFHGQPLRHTRAQQRTRAGDLAVPAKLAYGHELLGGQALTFDARSLFPPRSAHLTPHAHRVVVRLAYRMAHVTSARCEGYMDYGRAPVVSTSRLSTERAASLCRALSGQTGGLSTTAVGHGSSRPAVVGAGPSRRAENRRVVVVMRTSIADRSYAGAPTITRARSQNTSQVSWDVDLTWTTPDSDGGSPVIGYDWSVDGGSTWTAFQLSSLDGATHKATVDSGIGACSVGPSTVLVRAVNSAGGGLASTAYQFSRTSPGVCQP